MPTAKHRLQESVALLSDRNHLVFGVYCYVNPLMRSAVISYALTDASDIKLVIIEETSGKTVREMFVIRGNAGGRPGKNKIVWDGTDTSGLKVPSGTYLLQFSNGRQNNLARYSIQLA